MRTLFGIIELEQPIRCAKDVLGRSVPVSVDGVEGRIELPHAPDWSTPSSEPIRDPLLAPELARGWKRGADSIHWGRPASYPDCISDVEKMLLLFDVAESEVCAAGTVVHRGFGRWWSSFIDYLELTTKQRRSRGAYVVGAASGHLDLFAWNADGQTDRPYVETPVEIVVRLSGSDVALTPGQLIRICDFASSGNSLNTELKLQLEAYRALGAGDHRKAIIETAVAAEFALTTLIRSIFGADGIAYGEKLLEKFRMLGGRLDLARIVGVQLSDIDFKTALVEPRNEVIHRADYANEERALRAVEATDQLIELVSPSLWSRS